MRQRLGQRLSSIRRTATAAAVLTAVATAFAATPVASAHHQPGDVSLEAVTTLRPLGGHDWRGVVRLSAHPDGPTQVHGIMIGLLVPAVQAVHVGLAPQPCSWDVERPPADINDLYLMSAPPVRPNGTALLEEEGIFYFAQLRQASSVVLTGDADADGEQEIGACGDLDKHGVDWSGTGRRGVFATAAQLDGSGGAPGAGRLLMYDWAVGPDIRSAAVAVTDLEPGTRYALGVTRLRRGGSWDHCFERAGTALRFTTDPSGSALLAAEGLDARRLKEGGALVVARPSPAGPEVAACAGVQDGTLVAYDG